MRQHVLDPRMRQVLRPLFTQGLTTFVSTKGEPNAAGQVLMPIELQPVPGLVKLPSRKSPLIALRPTNTEDRTAESSDSITSYQIHIQGRYADRIDVTTMDLTFDNVLYHVLGVEEDGNTETTRVRVEVIKP